jgi:anti-sigma regulatory factor (Ser/Thr protein kinase)
MGLAAPSLPDRTWATQLRATADAPAEARWFFWSTVSPYGMPAEPETAVLLLSELVSNAARYGDRAAPIELVVTLSGEDLGVLVRSHGGTFDREDLIRKSDRHGLALVARLSVSWGIRTRDGAVEVWFEV